MRHFMNNIPSHSGVNLEKNTALGFFGKRFEPWGEFGIGIYIYIQIYQWMS